jgi:uncharacterized membrane protein HdeD (DUF308 family)
MDLIGAGEEPKMTPMLAKFWWLIVFRGVLAIVFGVLALAWPGMTLLVLIILFGSYAFADGIFALVHSINGRDDRESVWVLLLEGLIGIGVGLITFLEPAITGIILLFYIAAWSLTTGVLEIIGAINLRKRVSGEIWMLLSGIASMVFAIILLVHPGVGALALAWLIGAYAMLFGAILVALGLRLRGAREAAEA